MRFIDQRCIRRPSLPFRRPCRSQRAIGITRRLRPKRICASTKSDDGSVAQVSVVLGTQFGDEGKGKLVDILAQRSDFVCRAQVIQM